MTPRRLSTAALAMFWVCGCATTGSPTPEPAVRAATPQVHVGGLTSYQKQLLDRGPGEVTLAAAAELMPRDAEFQLLLQPRTLRDSGLLDALLDRAPSDYRRRMERLEAATGTDIIKRVDGFATWGLGDGAGLNEIRAVVVARSMPVIELYGWLDALETELEDDLANLPDQDDEVVETVLSGSLTAAEVDQIYQRLSQGIAQVERIQLTERTSMLIANDDGQLAYAYAWPRGLVVGMVPSFSGPLIDAGAQRIHASVSQIEEAVSTMASLPSVLPTLRARIVSEGNPLRIEGTVGLRTQVVLEAGDGMLGGRERVRRMLDQWDEFRDTLLRGLQQSGVLGAHRAFKDMVIDALEHGSISETVDGVRFETEVDTDLLSAGLRDFPG